jgi:hypothetical protein
MVERTSKFTCGKCFRGFDELQAFGDHLCAPENPFLAALGGGVINMGEYSIDLKAGAEEYVHQHKVQRTIKSLEDSIRRPDA